MYHKLLALLLFSLSCLPALAQSRGGISGPLVRTDHWPRTTNLADWTHDVMRLEGVEQASGNRARQSLLPVAAVVQPHGYRRHDSGLRGRVRQGALRSRRAQATVRLRLGLLRHHQPHRRSRLAGIHRRPLVGRARGRAAQKRRLSHHVSPAHRRPLGRVRSRATATTSSITTRPTRAFSTGPTSASTKISARTRRIAIAASRFSSSSGWSGSGLF